MRRSWRHLDFFQYEAWVHAEVPRVRCRSCGKTSRIEVPWSRPGSHFTLLFEALAMSLCQTMTVAETARLLRAKLKPNTAAEDTSTLNAENVFFLGVATVR